MRRMTEHQINRAERARGLRPLSILALAVRAEVARQEAREPDEDPFGDPVAAQAPPPDVKSTRCPFCGVVNNADRFACRHCCAELR